MACRRKLRTRRLSMMVVLIPSVCLVVYIIRLKRAYMPSSDKMCTDPVCAKSNEVNLLRMSYRPTSKSSQKNILLSAYMKSGSTYTGRLLGHRQDAFYFYEPLHNPIGDFLYYKNQTTLCSLRNDTCWPSKSSSSSTPITTARAVRMLSKVFQCNFEDFRDTFHPEAFQRRQGGPSWKPFNKCYEKYSSSKLCFQQLEQSCRNSSHVVAKVLRLGSDSMHTLLSTNENLKVIQLYRDPRAVINSRIRENGYPLKLEDSARVRKQAEMLCARMLETYSNSKVLSERFPGRYLSIRLEDLVLDKDKYRTHLYTFCDMNYISDLRIKLFIRPSWRTTLSWRFVNVIDDVCVNVYKTLGYVKFRTLEDIQNGSIEAVNTAPLLTNFNVS